jgi:hypothetical protein
MIEEREQHAAKQLNERKVIKMRRVNFVRE